jgi:hypothetical protein
MPADWVSFITNVSNKLDGQSIQASYDSAGSDVDDFATYLAQQYTNATVGKAQSPYGNTHVKGNESILIAGFSEAFKKLESERSPTFEEKSKDPNYKDLKEEPTEQQLESARSKFDLDFLAWAEENGSNIPDFIYSQFFSQYPGFPSTEEQRVLELARRIINQFDGTSDYLQWIYTLKIQNDEYKTISSKVYDKILELTKGLGSSEIKVGDEVQGLSLYPLNPNGTENRNSPNKGGELIRGKVSSINKIKIPLLSGSNIYSVTVNSNGKNIERILVPDTIQKKINVSDFRNVRNVNLSKKILQEDHVSDTSRIPNYLTSKFITRFTYDPNNDKNLFYRIIRATLNLVNYDGVQNSINQNLSPNNVLYSGSITKFLDGDFTNAQIQGANILSTQFLNNSRNYKDSLSVNNFLVSLSSKKSTSYSVEASRFLQLKRSYIDYLVQESKIQDESVNTEDPYYKMADSVIKYWISCLQQPLSSSPPVPPCTILPPLNGVYVGVYYGSIKKLGDSLRRAFNDGKSFKTGKTGKIVASSLASSFQKHLLELKFIYNGGIPTTGGPVPMSGFVSLVF